MVIKLDYITIFDGYSGKIKLYKNRIIIIRGRIFPLGVKTKEIYLTQIEFIQFKEPTWLRNGFIRFALIGETQEISVNEACSDENSVLFTYFKRKEFKEFSVFIQKFISDFKSRVVNKKAAISPSTRSVQSTTKMTDQPF